MLKPSYTELIDALNKNTYEDSEITSRYTIVIAAAKRARQLIAGDEPMLPIGKEKPISTAVKEMLSNKIQIVPEGEGTVLNLYLSKESETEEKSSSNQKANYETNLENEQEFEDESEYDEFTNDYTDELENTNSIDEEF